MNAIRARKLLLAGILAAGALLAIVFDPTPWKYRAAVRVLEPGRMCVLPIERTLYARMRQDLADLRIVRDGQEIPYVIETVAGALEGEAELTGRREVYLAGFPAGEPTRQVSFGGGECPIWSPDGKTLYFIAAQQLVSVPITPDGSISGGQAVVYGKPFGQSDPIARNYAIAPDGRPLIVEPSERRPTVLHLNVITDWYELLP